MAINKVVLHNDDGTERVLVDLTNDTVTPETLAKGETAHDKAGNRIIGEMTSGGSGVEEKKFRFNAIDTTGMSGTFLFDGSMYGERFAIAESISVLGAYKRAMFNSEKDPALVIAGDSSGGSTNGILLECEGDLFTVIALNSDGIETIIPYTGVYRSTAEYMSFYITPKVSGAIATKLTVGEIV